MSRPYGYLGEKHFRKMELQCKSPEVTVPGMAHLASEDQTRRPVWMGQRRQKNEK